MKKVISSKNSYMYSFFLISSAICIYLSNICSFETGNLRHNSSISEVDNRSSMLKTGSFDSYCFILKNGKPFVKIIILYNIVLHIILLYTYM